MSYPQLCAQGHSPWHPLVLRGPRKASWNWAPTWKTWILACLLSSLSGQANILSQKFQEKLPVISLNTYKHLINVPLIRKTIAQYLKKFKNPGLERVVRRALKLHNPGSIQHLTWFPKDHQKWSLSRVRNKSCKLPGVALKAVNKNPLWTACVNYIKLYKRMYHCIPI